MRAPATARAVELLRERGSRVWGDQSPEVHLVLGSGLGGLVARVEAPVSVPFADVPGFPATGVAGHAGEYVIGRLAGRRVLVQAGRFHLYEGYPVETVVAPVRIARSVGAAVTILTNAAGGLDPRMSPGDLMLIDDHVNLMWRHPLVGPVREGESRFPDMSRPYDPDLQRLAVESAAGLRVALRRGVYVGMLGPSYETPAEIRMLRGYGAHAVGMSTVPEAIVAAAGGTRVLAFSLITNMAAGMAGPLDHGEVVHVGREAGTRLGSLIEEVLRRLA